jgi:GNAT superfamily N-acetyltransferase
VRRERVVVTEAPAAVTEAWPAGPPPGVAIRPAGRTDLADLARLLPGGDAAGRLAAGDLAMVAEEGGRVVGCAWLATSEIRAPHWRTTVRPRPGEGYCYGLVVIPEARGRGLGRELARALRREGRRRGVQRFVSRVGAGNPPALAVQAACGATVRRRLLIVVLLDRLALLALSRRA